MTVKIAKLSSKNQIALPTEMLKAIKVEKGSKVKITTNKGTIVIEPIPDAIESLHGILKGKGSVQEFLDERRRDDEISERKYKRIRDKSKTFTY